MLNRLPLGDYIIWFHILSILRKLWTLMKTIRCSINLNWTKGFNLLWSVDDEFLWSFVALVFWLLWLHCLPLKRLTASFFYWWIPFSLFLNQCGLIFQITIQLYWLFQLYPELLLLRNIFYHSVLTALFLNNRLELFRFLLHSYLFRINYTWEWCIL